MSCAKTSVARDPLDIPKTGQRRILERIEALHDDLPADKNGMANEVF